jgi:hypothetical protein
MSFLHGACDEAWLGAVVIVTGEDKFGAELGESAPGTISKINVSCLWRNRHDSKQNLRLFKKTWETSWVFHEVFNLQLSEALRRSL